MTENSFGNGAVTKEESTRLKTRDRKGLTLKRSDWEEIRRIAEKTHPYECCGILGGRIQDGRKEVLRVFPARNEREDSPHNRYRISPRFHYQVDHELRKEGHEILGFFHSHPDSPAQPSRFDRDHAWPWYSYLIVSVISKQAGEALCWTLKEDRSGFDPEDLEIA